MGDALRIESLTLDLEVRRLVREERSWHLTPKAFELLVLLARKAPRVVPKVELHDALWPGTFVSDAAHASLVKEIRQVFRDAGERSSLLRTAHRVGFSLDCEPAPVGGESLPAVRYWLVDGMHAFVLNDGTNLLGRKPPAQIIIDHQSVSRRHACITVHGSDAAIEDLGSKNGTRVMGRPLAGRHFLSSGDEIEVGVRTVRFHAATDGGPTVTETVEASQTPPPARRD